ncbi:hypothetical protein BH20ACT8_BH20ACT8_17500 [soil metagenome]
MSPTGRLLVAVAFATVLFVPGVLWLTGFQGEEIENRDLTQAPAFDSPADVFDTDTYEQASAYVVDQLPLRSALVEANAKLNLEVFDESPNPAVTLGADGWLFLTEALDNVCEPVVPPDEVAARMNRLAGIVAGSGRELVLTIAPDKNAIYPEHLGKGERSEPEGGDQGGEGERSEPGGGDQWGEGDAAEKGACADETRSELRERLDAVTPPGYVDAYAAMEGIADAADRPVYYPHDTHWTTRGLASFVEQIVEALQPGLWDPEALTIREEPHTGDLTRLLGMPSELETQRTFVDRPGVATPGLEGDERLRPPSTGEIVTQAPEGTPRLPGRTLVIFDSFFDNAIGMLAPYTTELTFVRWGQFDETRFAELVRDHDVIVIESAERNAYEKYGAELGSEAQARALLDVLGAAGS